MNTGLKKENKHTLIHKLARPNTKNQVELRFCPMQCISKLQIFMDNNQSITKCNNNFYNQLILF